MQKFVVKLIIKILRKLHKENIYALHYLQDAEKLRPIETPSDADRQQLQEVDEFVAKAIVFNNVSKVK